MKPSRSRNGRRTRLALLATAAVLLASLAQGQGEQDSADHPLALATFTATAVGATTLNATWEWPGDEGALRLYLDGEFLTMVERPVAHHVVSGLQADTEYQLEAHVLTETDEGPNATAEARTLNALTIQPEEAPITVAEGASIVANLTLGGQQRLGTAVWTLALDSDNVTVEPTQITFSDWSDSIPVYINATDDAIDQDDEAIILSAQLAATSTIDSGTAAAMIEIVRTDDDESGLNATSPPAIWENQTTGLLNVSLTSDPQGDVHWNISASNPLLANVTPTTLSFGPGNWSTPQSISIAPIDDSIALGTKSLLIDIEPTNASASRYLAAGPQEVAIPLLDDDEAGFNATLTSNATTVTSSGGTMTLGVSLTSEPLGSVIVSVTSNMQSYAQPTPSFLTFTPTNWSVPQDVVLEPGSGITQDATVRIAVQAVSSLSSADYMQANSARLWIQVIDDFVTDTDGDGIPDEEEELAGTDPDDRYSPEWRANITAHRVLGDTARISWTAPDSTRIASFIVWRIEDKAVVTQSPANGGPYSAHFTMQDPVERVAVRAVLAEAPNTVFVADSSEPVLLVRPDAVSAVCGASAPDSDADGLCDALEDMLGTDPHAADTDGDGLGDYAEVFELRSDPLQATHSAEAKEGMPGAAAYIIVGAILLIAVTIVAIISIKQRRSVE